MPGTGSVPHIERRSIDTLEIAAALLGKPTRVARALFAEPGLVALQRSWAVAQP
jgi:hypothetical protein